ncbi:MAG: formate--tetrahydrofolate ligase, partial [Clostridia bacterium]|nr:formate--tetrahydrofolate ligase [Clostridia bacterium]
MLTDIEIAQSAKLNHISEIANQIGLLPEEYEPYGYYKAKITDKFLDRMASKDDGNL